MKDGKLENSTQIGRKAEKYAVEYLTNKSIEILELNYRHGRAEIDIIAKDKDVLVFIEVKYRTSVMFGFPETFVDKAKSQRIKNAAEYYIFEKDWQHDIRFDIVSIVEYKTISIEHFVDCF